MKGNSLKNYLNATKKYSTPRLIIEFFSLSLVWKIILFCFFALFILALEGFQTNGKQILIDLMNERTVSLTHTRIIDLIFIAPITETLFYQTLILWIIQKISTNEFKILILSAILFAIGHINPLAILFAFPMGILLSWTYICQQKHSTIQAIIITAILHACINLPGAFLMNIY